MVKEEAGEVLTWHGKQVGTAAAAGRRCISRTSRKGVLGSTYRSFIRVIDAPGPITYTDEGFGFEVQLRHPDNGAPLYDLAEVERWNENRPGPGRWGPRDTSDE